MKGAVITSIIINLLRIFNLLRSYRSFILMHFDKENYLSVTYQMNKGLNFKWNFKDLFQYLNYFHHLIIITEINSPDILTFLTLYYKKMKYGDLLSVIYYDCKRKQVRRMKWIQRSQINSFDFSQLVKKISSNQLPDKIKNEIWQMSVKQTQGEHQHFVVNFILESDSGDSEQKMRKMVEEGRKEGGFSHICSFFGKYKTSSVNFTDGINFFVFDSKDFPRVLQFYYTHINNAAIKNSRVTLQCTNGQIICYHSRVWKTIDFNKLQKTFYGPSVNYTQDQIHFHMTQAMLNYEFELILSLEITFFSNQKLRNMKKIKLSVPSMKYIDKSINMATYQSCTYCDGLELSYFPYSSFTIAKLMKN